VQTSLLLNGTYKWQKSIVKMFYSPVKSIKLILCVECCDGLLDSFKGELIGDPVESQGSSDLVKSMMGTVSVEVLNTGGVDDDSGRLEDEFMKWGRYEEIMYGGGMSAVT